MANLIADHIKGDTWDGFMFNLEDETEIGSNIYEPVDLTGATIISQFKTTPKGGMVFEFKTSDNSITIPTPANGEFFYEERIINVPANNYIFDENTGTIGGLFVVIDENMPDNQLIVGDRRYARIYEKTGVVLSKGLPNAQFLEDEMTIKARKRMLLLVKNGDRTGFRKVVSISASLATLAT
jgi:hypothetical protein